MDSIRIRGGRPLRGTIAADGAKNAALPALAASLLTDEALVLDNVPVVQDTRTMLRVLEHLGAEGWLEAGAGERGVPRAHVRTLHEMSPDVPYDIVRTMRATAMVLGPLLARRGRARVSLPGGCAIGARPMDYHVEALKALGADIAVEHGYLVGSVPGGRLRGAVHEFPKPTVTGTENVMMAATLAEGVTELRNCAREPEIVDLAALLAKMGARIEGAGTDRILVEGVDSLSGARHHVRPDRIVAGTFVLAGAIAGEDVTVTECEPADLEALLVVLRESGIIIETSPGAIRVRRNGPRRAVSVRTEPFPGFATDLQAQYMALATQVEGTTLIEETIFENRFMHVAELERMGAQVRISGNSAEVQGATRLSGAQVMATDLRASACLVLAALAAEGETTVSRVYHLDRGYQRIEEKLRRLGADVERVASKSDEAESRATSHAPVLAASPAHGATSGPPPSQAATPAAGA